ncbi:MAG TPA: DNA gyrase C-terminal beta-propeller domain-containing protein, partial [Stellaceae bacterium]|nr:DNA gyrase C-terminal beta-propeller domain-containing protein [Stellaceae bacterium]
TSAYDYPITGRGGQGRDNIVLERGQGHTIAVFPVAEADQVMLVTDAGMVIRVPVTDISIRRRRSGGVVVIKVEDGERVVSAARFPEAGENGEDAPAEEGPA